MIDRLVTYLPERRTGDVESYFVENIERIEPKHSFVYLDSPEKAPHYLWKNIETVQKNWNSSFVTLIEALRDFKSSQDGTMLLIDSDNVMPYDFNKTDSRLNLPFYSVCEENSRNMDGFLQRSNQKDEYVKMYRIYESLRKPFFFGPKQAIRLERSFVERLNWKFIDKLEERARSPMEEVPLGMILYFSGIREVPWIVCSYHHRRIVPSEKFNSSRWLENTKAYSNLGSQIKWMNWRLMLYFLRYKSAYIVRSMNPPQQTIDMTKWEFGGGSVCEAGWFNVDIIYGDLKHDLTKPFPKEYYGTVREGRFSHGPEHYTRYELPDVLKNISDVMADNGSLEVRCPDMDRLAKDWLREGATRDNLRGIFGEDSEFQVHKNGLNYDYLAKELERAGFGSIKSIAPREGTNELRVVCVKLLRKARN